MMGTFAKRVGVYCLALTMGVFTSGCKTMGPLAAVGESANLSPSEKRLREDEARFNQTVFGGVVTGAVIGGLLGGLTAALGGGNRNQVQAGVLTGAVAGGVLGGVDGYATAKKQQAGNNEVRAIQAAVADLQQDNARLQQVIATSDAVLREGQQRLASIKSDVAAGRISSRQAEDARKREENNIALLNKSLEKARETRTQYSQAGQRMTNDSSTRRNLDAEIEKTDRQIAQLERNISDYSRALAVSRA
mgnify:FL=1